MLFKSDPKIIEAVPDSEKLSIVYAYVLRKEKEETAAKIRKWAWRIFLIVSIYFSYLQLISLTAKGGMGSISTSSGMTVISKTISSILTPIVKEVAQSAVSEMSSDGSTPPVNLTPAQIEQVRQMQRKNIPSR
jgi:hypothetical protein